MERALANRIETWLRQEALPLWTTVGLDRVNGGVEESLTLDAKQSSGAPFKRCRVAGRQIYVFSHAQTLGWGGVEEAAEHTYRHFVERFWQGADQGWAKLLTPEGAVLDATPDLYDYAFALFALGWRFKATGDREALTLAHQTMDLIDGRFRHPGGAGFHHELPASLPRQQNPHMHLMEAALVLAQAGEERFLRLADELAGLFKTKIAHFPDGVLPEFFDEAWRPVEGDKGRWVEPGHQFEWAWILAQHQLLTGADHKEAVSALVQRAERFGVDPRTGVTVNGVRDDGLLLDGGTRSWPNTERMKGWLGWYELTGEDPSGPVAKAAAVLFERVLGPAPKGAWLDALDANGVPVAAAIPTSTLYHVFLAFTEALRLSERIIADHGQAYTAQVSSE